MKRYVSEFLGTAFLLAIVVGSGIMGQSLSSGNEAIALLANSLATGAGLFVLIQCLGPISGAHFNPVVSLVEFFWGRLKRNDLIIFWIMQISGAGVGVVATHLMFSLPIVQVAEKHREGINLAFSEFVATFGLITVIALSGKKQVEKTPVAVAAYIMSAYWFTSSTSFANPAVTIARSLTNSFCGIAPAGITAFIAAQFLGAITAYFLLRKVDAK